MSPNSIRVQVIQNASGAYLAPFPSFEVAQGILDAQIEEAVALAMRAFDGDNSVDSMTGGNNALRPALFRSMIKAGAAEGSFYVVSEGDSKSDGHARIHSIGVWFGPGKKLFDSEEQRDLGWNEYFASLTDDTRNWWFTTFHTKHEENLSRLLGESYLDDWFANIIATDPAHQRKGYASAMIKEVFRVASKEGKTVALATQNDKNAEFYRNLDFEVIGKEIIPGPTGYWLDYFLRWGYKPHSI